MKPYRFKPQIEAIRDYFNLDLKERDISKLQRILSSVPPRIVEKKVWAVKKEEVVKVVNKYIPVSINVDHNLFDKNLKVSLETELMQICHHYDVSYDAVRSGKRISDNVTRAKVHFCRYIMLICPNMTTVRLAAFLRLDHTSVLNLLYESNIDCAIPPIEKRRVSINKIYLPVDAGIKNTITDNQ